MGNGKKKPQQVDASMAPGSDINKEVQTTVLSSTEADPDDSRYGTPIVRTGETIGVLLPRDVVGVTMAVGTAFVFYHFFALPAMQSIITGVLAVVVIMVSADHPKYIKPVVSMLRRLWTRNT